MEELYSETFLKAKPPVKWKVIRVLLIILAAFFVAIGLFFSLLMGTMLVFFVMVILAGIVFYFVPTNKIAYEYIFVDGQIDFDRILNGSKRKTMQRIDMEKIAQFIDRVEGITELQKQFYQHYLSARFDLIIRPRMKWQ